MRPRSKTYTILDVKKCFLFAFVLVFITYLFTSGGKTPYDYSTRLSDSFLQGKYYLTENPPWLNELIPSGDEKYFVAYPPMPSVLLMPFRSLFGENFEQQFLAHLLGSGIAILSMAISWTIKKDKKLMIWTGALTAFGNIIWFLSTSGSSWYLGQVSAAFFLSAAIYESLNKKRPVITGVLLGAACLSRIEIILSFPFFLYIYKSKKQLTNYFKIIMGGLPFLLFNFFYNYKRFGVIWDKGYMLIPGVLEEAWYQNGLVNFTNIPHHLKILLLALPKFSKEFPFITPSWAGLAIWITTPAFVYSLFANLKEKVIKASWIAILAIALLLFSHGTTGFAQFGYRFAVDFYPFLIFLTIKGVAKTGLKWHHWLLLILSIMVNTWGTLWINKFGWVGY